MKSIISASAFFLLLLIPGLGRCGSTPDQLFQQGNEAYKSGQYQQAVEAYSAILQSGMECHELYYNLGNAYYRLDEYGQAILCYERALRLRPNSSDARQNLVLAQSRTEDEIAPLPEIFLVQWGRAVLHWFSPTGWRMALLAVLLLLAAATVAFFLLGDYRLRKASLITALALTLLLIVTVICSVSSGIQQNRHDEAIITQPLIVVKSSPEENSVDKLVLHEGTKVAIDETLGDWHKVHIADGNTGWVTSSDITII